MEKNVETEIKLLIGKKDMKTLLASPLVAKKTKKGSHKTIKLVNIYYDTRDLLLQQAGIAYRVRQDGKKYEATVKLSKKEAGGLSARQEYNVAVKIFLFLMKADCRWILTEFWDLPRLKNCFPSG